MINKETAARLGINSPTTLSRNCQVQPPSTFQTNDMYVHTSTLVEHKSSTVQQTLKMSSEISSSPTIVDSVHIVSIDDPIQVSQELFTPPYEGVTLVEETIESDSNDPVDEPIPHSLSQDGSYIAIRTYDELQERAIRIIQQTRSLACFNGEQDEENINPLEAEILKNIASLEEYKTEIVDLQRKV
jgi:hypothetical protein